ncbi:recombinase family protein, partial [Escherichia coli]|uniref:recombinase family protein n=3 Tax=Bacteria TaxID=2 RepID=UPI0034A35743
MDEPDLGVYAMYLRKSRADAEKERQGEDTLAKHERELSAFSAARRYLVDESDVYREVVSGESVADRKEFQRLMQGVTQRRYKGVIVKAIDRLGRGDIMEYGWILSTFQWTRTLIITPDKVYNPNDQADMQSLQLQMLISNGELKAAKARLAAGRAQSVRDGQYIGTIPPYGYDRTVVDRMHTLKPNDRAPIVVVIFELAASGWGASAIANKLNRAGIPAFGGGFWIPSVIKR